MLLSFEGLDGCGKSTQAKLLQQRLEASGLDPVLVREPGGPPLSERIRQLLLSRDLQIEPFAELLLFSAARAQLVAHSIRPALEEGKVVVCDRFFDSTIAYQGGGRGIAGLPWLRDFCLHVTGDLVPTRTYYLQLDARTARRRSDSRSRADRMESGDDAFFQRVEAAYEWLADEEEDRIVRIDASLAIEAQAEQIWSDVRQLLTSAGTTDRKGGFPLEESGTRTDVSTSTDHAR